MESWSLVKLRLRLLLSSPEFLWSLWGKAASVEHAETASIITFCVFDYLDPRRPIRSLFFTAHDMFGETSKLWCDESGVVAWLHSDRLLEQMSLPMPWYFSRVSALSNCFTMGHLATDPATLCTFYFQEMCRASSVCYWVLSCPPVEFPIPHGRRCEASHPAVYFQVRGNFDGLRCHGWLFP